METIELVKKAKENDENAKNELIKRYTPLIISQITKYKHIEGYDYDDLFQYGILSILKGIKIFNIEKSNSFGSYIKWTIINNFAYLCRKENDDKKKTISLNIVTEDGVEIMQMLEDPLNIEKIYMENMEVQRILDAIEMLESEEKELCKFILKNEGRGNLKEFSKQKETPYHRILYKKKVLARKLEDLIKNM